MMKKTIKKFVEDKKVALVGASRNSQKWGNAMAKALKKKGYAVYPVNPREKEVEGLTCYPTVKALPRDVSNAIIAVSSATAIQVLQDCAGTGIRRVWLHRGGGGPGASTPEAVRAAQDAGLEVVYGFCPMMFYPPAGIHGVHLFFRKLSGNVPKEYKGS